MESLRKSPDYVELTTGARYVIDLRYATQDNFVGRNLYGDFTLAFLHRLAAEKLEKALTIVQTKHPGYRFVIYDALRPRSVQKILFDHVKGTALEIYVAKPYPGSMHNFGFAVDLSILNETGTALDMGTPFDCFSELSQPKYESRFLEEGKLTQQQWQNRLLLRSAMEAAEFISLPHEWWHFDALPREQVRAHYPIIE